jgi:periplasmic protein TonB
MSRTEITSIVVAVGCHALVLLGYKFPAQRPISNEKIYHEVSLVVSAPVNQPILEEVSAPVSNPQIEEPSTITGPETEWMPRETGAEAELNPATAEPAPSPEPPELISQAAPDTEKPAPHEELKPTESQPMMLPADPSDAVTSSPAEIAQPLKPQIAAQTQTGFDNQPQYQAVEQPYYRKRGRPEYPPEAKRLKQEGVLLLALFINEKGRLDKVEVVQSSGFPLLDQAAIEAEQRSRFRPAFLDGKPIACKAEVPYRFVLPR